MVRRSALAALAASLALPAAADVVHLRSGGAVRGRVTEQDDAVILQVGTARVTYPKAMVTAIDREPAPEQVFAERMRTLKNPTADDLAALATWCRDEGLPDPERQCWERALRLDPDHPAARRALGYVRWDDRWVTEDALHAALGEVRFRGRWMQREEMQATIESEKAAREARELADQLERKRLDAAEAGRRREARARADEEAARRREIAETRRRENELLQEEYIRERRLEAASARPARVVTAFNGGWWGTLGATWIGPVWPGGSWFPPTTFRPACVTTTAVGPVVTPCPPAGMTVQIRREERQPPPPPVPAAPATVAPPAPRGVAGPPAGAVPPSTPLPAPSFRHENGTFGPPTKG